MAQDLFDLTLAPDYDPNSMPVTQARQHIRAFLTPLTTPERLHIRQALGRIVAEDIVSPLAVPGHDNSAMDGYAVRHADLKPDVDVTLQVAGTSLAGKPFAGTVAPGEAVRIFTGAVLPPECDTVIMQERAVADGGMVILGKGA
ncbi:MAG: molybdopterin molybdenumtransferase MoeA, partial [Burkholderiales bacterium]|nr:molybdopterin molybdenumtransferase MoeA [Burkholderiales bacterium]